MRTRIIYDVESVIVVGDLMEAALALMIVALLTKIVLIVQ
jgi:hypothetical protein